MFICCMCTEEKPEDYLSHECECGNNVCIDCADQNQYLISFCPDCHASHEEEMRLP